MLFTVERSINVRSVFIFLLALFWRLSELVFPVNDQVLFTEPQIAADYVTLQLVVLVICC